MTDERAIRTALTVGPVLSCVGIAWTAIAPSTLSGSAVLIGVATAIWGTHKFGRLGADTPTGVDTPAEPTEPTEPDPTAGP